MVGKNDYSAGLEQLPKDIGQDASVAPAGQSPAWLSVLSADTEEVFVRAP